MKCLKILFTTIIFASILTSSIIGKNNGSIKIEENKVENNFLQLRYEFSQYNNLKSLQEFNMEEVNSKSPWLAFGLSLMFPGLGQIYNGDYTKAAIQAGLALGGFGLVSLTGCTECGQSGELQTAAFFTGLGLTFVGYIWSLFDAPISANKINAQLNYKDIKQAFNNRSIISGKNHKMYLSSNILISIKIKF